MKPKKSLRNIKPRDLVVLLLGRVKKPLPVWRIHAYVFFLNRAMNLGYKLVPSKGKLPFRFPCIDKAIVELAKEKYIVGVKKKRKKVLR